MNSKSTVKAANGRLDRFRVVLAYTYVIDPMVIKRPVRRAGVVDVRKSSERL